MIFANFGLTLSRVHMVRIPILTCVESYNFISEIRNNR